MLTPAEILLIIATQIGYSSNDGCSLNYSKSYMLYHKSILSGDAKQFMSMDLRPSDA
jgi:hypothetical protein